MKGKKRAFLLSFLSLLMCVSMFIGTTFAWFTDSASSGVNTIVAGNLDIEVKYLTKDENGETQWETIEGKTTLFSNNYWEPGHTEVVYLKVQNLGTLGFNYKVMVTPVSENGGVNVDGESFKLSDYLVFGTTAPSTAHTTYDRDGARQAVGTTTGLADVNSLTKTGTMVGKNVADYKDQYMALVVYMPESVGNKANYKSGTSAPTIELGIKVVATQLTNESDSFGPDYDNGATNDSFYTVGAYYDYFEAVNEKTTANEDGSFTVTKTGENTGVIASASGTAQVGAEINLLVMKSSDAEKNFSATVGDGYELNGYEIKVTGHTPGTLVQSKLYVGTGLENFKFYHNGTEMEVGTQGSLTDGQYVYNSADGFVYFASKTFSPFQATYKAPAAAIGSAVYGTLAEAFKASESGDTIVMLKDFVNANLSSAVNFSLKNGVTLNGNGHAIRGNSSLYMATAAGATSTVKNVTFQYIHNGSFASQSDCDWYGWEDGKQGTKSAIYASYLYGTVNIIGCTFDNADWDAIQMTPYSSATINIIGNTFSHSSPTDYSQLRYIHIEGLNSSTATINVNDNRFYKTKDPDASPITNIGIWRVALENMNLTGNYFEYDPSSEIIDTNSEVSSSGSFDSEGFIKLFPARDALGNEVYPAAFTYKSDTAYMTLQGAIDNAKNASTHIYLIRDNTESVTISEETSRSIRLYGMKLSNLVNNGKLTFDNGSSTPGTATIINNGTLSLTCSEATGFKVVNNGVLNITYCGASVAYSQSNITNNSGGQVKVTANKAYFTDPIDPAWTSWANLTFHKSKLQSNGYYAYVPYSDEEAIAEGAVVRSGKDTSASRRYFTTLQEGVQGQAVYLIKDVSENVTRTDGNVSFYGEDFTYTGSLSSSANVNIYNGTAVIDSINGVNLTFGSAQNTKGLTVTVKDGVVTGNILVNNNKTGGTTAVIEGGTYTGSITVKTGASLTIKGGTFSSDPSQYVPLGYKVEQDNGVWTVSKSAGTEEDPIQIKNESDWLNFASIGYDKSGTTNQYYVVEKDLDFKSISGTAGLRYFAGNIDFKGHSISGLTGSNTYTYRYPSIFKYVEAGATIKNLKYELPNLGTDYTVKPIGAIEGAGTVTLENIAISGNLNMTDNNTGLLIDFIGGSSKFIGTVNLIGCTSTCNMINSGYSSVFIGGIYKGGNNITLNAKDCVNYGKIISTGSQASMLISNGTHYSGDSLTLNITNCRNEGQIIAAPGKSSYLVMPDVGTESKFFTAEEIKAFETSGAIVNANGGFSTSLNAGQLAVVDGMFDLTTAMTKVPGATRFELSFGFQGTGGLGGGGVTQYSFTFDSREAVQNVSASNWVNASEATGELTAHNEYGTTYYTDEAGHYVYNLAGYIMNNQPEVTFIAYDANGNVMLVDFYSYAG